MQVDECKVYKGCAYPSEAVCCCIATSNFGATAIILACFLVQSKLMLCRRTSSQLSPAALRPRQHTCGWLCAFIVQIVAIFHITFTVNSGSHVWGNQPYNTGDLSKNSWWIAILSMGEWHNNHHAFEGSANTGLEWWQFDATYTIIQCMALMGLVYNVRLPSKEKLAKAPRNIKAAWSQHAVSLNVFQCVKRHPQFSITSATVGCNSQVCGLVQSCSFLVGLELGLKCRDSTCSLHCNRDTDSLSCICLLIGTLLCLGTARIWKWSGCFRLWFHSCPEFYVTVVTVQPVQTLVFRMYLFEDCHCTELVLLPRL